MSAADPVHTRPGQRPPTAAWRHPEVAAATTVVIVGGGFTGAAVAYHLARDGDGEGLRILVVEPRERLGAGLAYDTDDPVHRINVPAAKMSLLPDDEGHFLRWLTETGRRSDDAQAARPDGALFPRRAVFGDYVGAQLRPSQESGRVTHVRAAVTAIRRSGPRWEVDLSAGGTIPADVVVLAASHPAPAPPAALAGLAGHPGFRPDPTAPGGLAGVPREAGVLVVGAGLTAADIVASLRERGHEGRITLLSRHGLRSRGHAPLAAEPFGDFAAAPATTAVGLLVRIRATLAAAARAGLTWHPVFDAIRAQGGAIWRALPIPERRRLVRHLRTHWDVHRFRIAPQVEAVLDADVASGRLALVAGRVVAASPADEGRIAVTIRRRGRTGTEILLVDVVALATGPAHGSILATQPQLAALAAAGDVAADPVGLGIACDDRARALDARGRPHETLFVAGPLARGTFGELMGLPQVSEQAALVAAEIGRIVTAGRDGGKPVLARA